MTTGSASTDLGADAPVNWSAMSPDERNATATALLAEKAKAYHAAQRQPAAPGAQARGDQLDQLIDGTLPLAGGFPDHTTSIGQVGVREQMTAYADMRERGIAPEAIKELAANVPVPAEVYDEVDGLRSDYMSNAEWVKRLLEGDREARRELDLISMVRVQGRGK